MLRRSGSDVEVAGPEDDWQQVVVAFPKKGLFRRARMLTFGHEMQKHLLAFHWRLRDFSVRPAAMDFVQFSRDCWFGGFDIAQFRVIGNDLALGDQAISEASQEDVSSAQSTATERHLAINWLMGYSEIYSQTDTST